jgi:uncharacterized Zn finger protein
MFRLEETNISKAVERCKALKPIVRTVRFGEYTVTSSANDGSTYTVKCFRDEEGFKTVDCSCKTRDGIACKHGVAAVSLHLYQAQVQSIMMRHARIMARRQATAATGARYN